MNIINLICEKWIFTQFQGLAMLFKWFLFSYCRFERSLYCDLTCKFINVSLRNWVISKIKIIPASNTLQFQPPQSRGPSLTSGWISSTSLGFEQPSSGYISSTWDSWSMWTSRWLQSSWNLRTWAVPWYLSPNWATWHPGGLQVHNNQNLGTT